MLREETSYLCLRKSNGEGSGGGRRRAGIGCRALEMSAKGVNQCMYFGLGSGTWMNIMCPSSVNLKGLQLDDVAEGS
jgi:hypothetical protein